MTRNTWLVLGVLLVASAAWLVDAMQLSPRAEFHERDVQRLDALLAARVALEASVLEARAELRLSFDPINRALASLRDAAPASEALQARGAAYAPAAERVALAAHALESQEAAAEQFKTELALLRLSQLQTLGASLDDRGREERDMLSSHTRATVDRRERVDQLARTLVRSPVRAQLEAARAAYVRSARRQAQKAGALQMLSGMLALAGVGVLASVVLRSARTRRP